VYLYEDQPSRLVDEILTFHKDYNYVKAKSFSKFGCDRNSRYAVIDGLPVASSGTPAFSGHRNRARPGGEPALDPSVSAGCALVPASGGGPGSHSVGERQNGKRDCGIRQPDISELFFALGSVALAVQAESERRLLSADLV
jgi:hypothetical protein